MLTGPAMIGPIGMPELLVILGIAVLIFGASRVPQIAKSLGQAIKEFKKAGKDISDDVKEVTEGEEKSKEE